MTEDTAVRQESRSSSPLPVGTVLRDRYRIKGLLSEGMGRVYEALDLASDRLVIIKEATGASPEALARLVTERETLVRLDHPGVMKALDFISEETAAYLVLERVEGASLLEYLEAHPGPIPENLLVEWGVQIAEILTYLHSQGPPVIYRDLKPEHALLQDNGRLLLIDFGISRVKKGGPRDTLMLGTPGYAAPEQYGLGTGESDERTDIYGLGATLFHLATRRHLAEVTTLPVSKGGTPPDIREFTPGYSERLAQVVRRALSHDPGERYPSAEGLLRGLRDSRADAAATPAGVILGLSGLAASGAVAGYAGWSCIAAREAGTMAPPALACVSLCLAGASALLGVWGRRRRLPWAGLASMATLLVGLAVLLAALQSGFLGSLAAHARRFALNELPVPLQGPLVVWMLVGAWAGLVSWSLGELVRRPRPASIVIFLALAGVGLLQGAHSESLSLAQDTRVSPNVVFNSKILWQQDVPAMERLRVGWRGASGGPDSRTLLLYGMGGRLQGLDRETGKVLWEQERPRDTGIGELPGHVLVPQGDSLVARKLDDAKVTWTARFKGAPTGSVMAGDHLVVSVGSEWHALDPATGKPLWVKKMAGSIRGGYEGKLLVVDDERARVSLMEAATQKELWTVDTQAPSGMHFFEPEAGVVLWATQHEILGIDLGTGKIRYRLAGPRAGQAAPLTRPWLVPRRGTPIRIVVAGNRIVAFDVSTGKVVQTVSCGLENVAGVFEDQEELLVTTAAGRLLAFDPVQGLLRWERWKRGAVGAPEVIGRDSQPFYLAGSFCVYQDPSSRDIMIMDDLQGTLLARTPLEGRYFLKALDFEESRIFLGLDGDKGLGRVVCIQVPTIDRGRPR